MSREFDVNTEWSLSTELFQKIVCHFDFTPEIDLFATRLNYKIDRYASWLPDPGAIVVDAFSISWTSLHVYAYPPFSLVGKCHIQNHKRQHTWDHDYPGMANTALVSTCNEALDTLPSTSPKGKFHHRPAIRYATEASTGLDNTASSCASLQHAIRNHNFSTEIDDIILHSWSSGTISKYNSIL